MRHTWVGRSPTDAWARATKWSWWRPPTGSTPSPGAVAKWQGTPPGHLDALERILRVDGYDVTLTPATGGDGGGVDLLEMETFN